MLQTKQIALTTNCTIVILPMTVVATSSSSSYSIYNLKKYGMNITSTAIKMTHHNCNKQTAQTWWAQVQCQQLYNKKKWGACCKTTKFTICMHNSLNSQLDAPELLPTLRILVIFTHNWYKQSGLIVAIYIVYCYNADCYYQSDDFPDAPPPADTRYMLFFFIIIHYGNNWRYNNFGDVYRLRPGTSCMQDSIGNFTIAIVNSNPKVVRYWYQQSELLACSLEVFTRKETTVSHHDM